MKAFGIILALLGVLAFSQPSVNSTLGTSVVNTKVVWPNQATLEPDAFVKNFLQALEKEYYIERLDLAYEEVLDTKVNEKTDSKVVVKKVYCFVQPANPHFPDALVSFKVQSTTYGEKALKNPKAKVRPSVVITLEEPFQLYTDYFDFAINKFDVNSLALKVQATSDSKNWTVQASFNLKNLFLISWLTSVKQSLKIKEEPKVHGTLLFFQQRFQEMGTRIYEIISKK